MSGLEVLQSVKERSKDIPVIMITAYATVDMSIQALRKGAYDMLTKPFEPEELIYRVKNALQQSELLEENRELRKELEGKFCFDNIIGTSGSLKNILGKVEKVAVRDTSVLITGESGSGKELIAQAIHYNSPRHERKFIAINCGALPETLLESELFGYRKGAFTGATENRQGLLEAADGGTLFLDEVGNLPMNVQKTLLRFLQEKEFDRLGDTTPTRVDVRDPLRHQFRPHAEVAKDGRSARTSTTGSTSSTSICPPLRERRDDIPLLVGAFPPWQNQKFGTSCKGLTTEALEAACAFDWPGNIRQLRNVIEAALTIESGSSSVCRPSPSSSSPASPANFQPRPTMRPPWRRFETEYLTRLLRKHAGNVEAAAAEAGMNMATVYRKLKKYGIRKRRSTSQPLLAGMRIGVLHFCKSATGSLISGKISLLL